MTDKNNKKTTAISALSSYITEQIKDSLEFEPDERGMDYDLDLTDSEGGWINGNLILPDGTKIPYGAWLHGPNSPYKNSPDFREIEPYQRAEICNGDVDPSEALRKLWDAAIKESEDGEVSVEIKTMPTEAHDSLLGLLAELVSEFDVTSDVEEVAEEEWLNTLAYRLKKETERIYLSYNKDKLLEALSAIQKIS